MCSWGGARRAARDSRGGGRGPGPRGACPKSRSVSVRRFVAQKRLAKSSEPLVLARSLFPDSDGENRASNSDVLFRVSARFHLCSVVFLCFCPHVSLSVIHAGFILDLPQTQKSHKWLRIEDAITLPIRVVASLLLHGSAEAVRLVAVQEGHLQACAAFEKALVV